MRFRIFTLGFIFALLWSAGAFAYPFRPADDFRTLHTEHFRITYHDPYRFAALRAAVIAEEQFAVLTARYGWTPHTPFDVVMTDRTDLSNGSSSITPVQVTRLLLAPPHPTDRLDYYDDWLRLLITHELTHAVETDMVFKLNTALRYTFGRLTPLGHFQPQGFIEGNAVFQETDLTTKGRNRSAHSLMMLRMAALDDRWPTLDQIAVFPREWPSGAAPYIWGGLFHQYLVERFGMEKVAAYYRKHAGQIWPFLFNHDARVVFGTHMSDLYEAWTKNEKARFAADRDRLTTIGLTPATRLTTNGFQHDSPRWLDADRLLFFEDDPDRTPNLRVINLAEARPKDRRLVSVEDVRGLDVTDTGAIVYADLKPHDRWHAEFDLWRLPSGASCPRRITTLARFADPAAVPGTSRVIGTTQEGGLTRLTEIDLETGELRHLTEPDDSGAYFQYAQPAVHPSGRWLAVSVWHDDGNRDLFRFDLETRAFSRLTADPELDLAPAFDPTGRHLLFSSSRTGVYNIYALDLETGKLYRVTNVLGGAFNPAVDPTGKRLAFVGYNGGGFDVYATDFAPERWTEVARESPEPDALVVGPITRDINRRAREIDPPTDNYQAYRTAWPHYWLPAFSLSDDDLWLGAQTAGFDVAGYHAWSAEALWAFERRFLDAYVNYTYSRFTPNLQLLAAQEAVNLGKIVYNRDLEWVDYYERRITGQALVTYPVFYRHLLFAGYLGQDRRGLDDPDKFKPKQEFVGYWSGARFGWTFDQGLAANRPITFPSGFGATIYDEALGGVISQQLLGGQLGVYVPLPFREGSLSLTALGGISFGEQLRERDFRLGGYTQSNPLFLSFLSDRFALPGYDGSFQNGDRVATGTAAFTFPLFEIERGISTWPIYFRDIGGRTFADAGFALDRDEPLTDEDLYPSAGFDLYFDWLLAYAFAARIQTSVAYGFRDRQDTGGFHWFFTFGGLIP
ncbi:MAG: hypothetical protein GX444_15940 [Myxococcales bacterium]|nr:hypothetical protein [Myxococcales bacterium]